MGALQIWLQNHNCRLTQDAIDEALMEYITHVEKQRDELLAALERIAAGPGSNRLSTAIEWAKEAIASVKGGA